MSLEYEPSSEPPVANTLLPYSPLDGSCSSLPAAAAAPDLKKVSLEWKRHPVANTLLLGGQYAPIGNGTQQLILSYPVANTLLLETVSNTYLLETAFERQLQLAPRRRRRPRPGKRYWCFIAEQPAPAPHLARPKGRAALMHMCYLLCSVSAALTSFFQIDSITTSYRPGNALSSVASRQYAPTVGHT